MPSYGLKPMVTYWFLSSLLLPFDMIIPFSRHFISFVTVWLLSYLLLVSSYLSAHSPSSPLLIIWCLSPPLKCYVHHGSILDNFLSEKSHPPLLCSSTHINIFIPSHSAEYLDSMHLNTSQASLHRYFRLNCPKWNSLSSITFPTIQNSSSLCNLSLA